MLTHHTLYIKKDVNALIFIFAYFDSGVTICPHAVLYERMQQGLKVRACRQTNRPTRNWQINIKIK